MVIEPPRENRAKRRLQTRHVYLIGAVCLVCGLAAGYTVRGSRMPASTVARPAASVPFQHPNTGQRPSLAQMQEMAGRQAAPLIAKLKTDPANIALLVQVGALYHTTQQYQLAASYYGRAAAVDPKNVANRTRLAASLYRGGDIEGAMGQLSTALSYDPKDANALFNTGLIEWEGKHDGAGAVTVWKKLLKTNPQLSPDRKATVQKLIAEVQAHSQSAGRATTAN